MMAGSFRKDMQHRQGLINGGPTGGEEIDEQEIKRSIDRMVYLEAIVLGILFGGILALFLTGRI